MIASPARPHIDDGIKCHSGHRLITGLSTPLRIPTFAPQRVLLTVANEDDGQTLDFQDAALTRDEAILLATWLLRRAEEAR